MSFVKFRKDSTKKYKVYGIGRYYSRDDTCSSYAGGVQDSQSRIEFPGNVSQDIQKQQEALFAPIQQKLMDAITPTVGCVCVCVCVCKFYLYFDLGLSYRYLSGAI